jgi:hypothetical protein
MALLSRFIKCKSNDLFLFSLFIKCLVTSFGNIFLVFLLSMFDLRLNIDTISSHIPKTLKILTFWESNDIIILGDGNEDNKKRKLFE